jgi:hypothetical protein
MAASRLSVAAISFFPVALSAAPGHLAKPISTLFLPNHLITRWNILKNSKKVKIIFDKDRTLNEEKRNCFSCELKQNRQKKIEVTVVNCCNATVNNYMN